MTKLLTIVGAGPGISQSVAKRFGREGFSITLIARSADKLKVQCEELSALNIDANYFTADASDHNSLDAAIKKASVKSGTVEVLLYNAARIISGSILEQPNESILEDFKVNVLGALSAVRAALPLMESGKGALLFTGGGLSIHPLPSYASLAIGKAGMRNLAGSLHQELKPKGIFVGTVTVRGYVQATSKKYSPELIAEEFWKLYTERNQVEIIY